MAGVACPDVLLDKRDHPVPVVVPGHQLDRLPETRVTSHRRVVVDAHNLCSQILVVRHIDLAAIEEKPLLDVPVG